MIHTPRDPDFELRVRASYARQAAMATLGATLSRVDPGHVEIELPFRADLTQQHGFLHAGVVTSVMDSACGYAAMSLMEAGVAVLSVEFKVNLLAPAIGSRFLARGRVVRAGRTLTFCAGEVLADDERVVATITATMMQRRSQAAGRGSQG